jgi:hypothetical protein
MSEQMEFEFSLTGLKFKFKGPSSRVGQALQSGLQQSINGLLNTQRTVLTAPAALPAPNYGDADPSSPDAPNSPTANGNGATGQAPAKKPRKSGSTPLKVLLRGLKTEGYFKEPRGLESIREKLKEKGHNVTPSSLSSRLKELTQQGELHRQRSGDGFSYKDSPFDDSPRTTDTPGETAS